MAVLNAFRQTPRSLVRNPVLFVPVLVLMALQMPQYVMQSANPVLASVVSLGLSLVLLAVMPFFQAGMIGMADEALDGPTSLDTFVADGKSNYLTLLVAYLALLAVNLAIGMIGFFAALTGGVFLLGGRLESMGTPLLAVVAVVVALAVLAYLLLLFFLQFYGQAIVIDGLGAVDGFKHSIAVVRRHLASTLGYTVLVAILGGVAGLIFGLASVLASPGTVAAVDLPEPSLGLAVAAGLLVVVLGTALGGFFGVYSVAFYRAIND